MTTLTATASPYTAPSPRRSWDESLELTAAYVKAHGKNPTQTNPDPEVSRLAFWLRDQRRNATPQRQEVLDATVPGWRGHHPGHRPWDVSLREVQAFVSKSGRLPRATSDRNELRTCSLRRNIAFFRGDTADIWLADALDLARGLADAWNAAPEAILEGGAMSRCLRCLLCRLDDGAAAVLKVPESRGAGIAESSALSMWRKSAPEVLASDQRSGAFLMEFVTATGAQPDGDDIAGLLDRLHVAPAPRLRPLDDILQARISAAAARFAGLAAETTTLEDAAAVIDTLQRSAQPTLVHGDFQAKNVIHTAAGAIAIDPLADPVPGEK